MTSSDFDILVVDDSAIFRRIVSNCLTKEPWVRFVNTAVDGQDALEKISRSRPGAITLDVEMPRLCGIETLRELKSRQLDIPVIMVSSLTQEGAAVTVEALGLGAYDFVTKPDAADVSQNTDALKQQLISPLKAIFDSRKSARKPKELRFAASSTGTKSQVVKGLARVLAVGASTGGPQALESVLSGLPETLSVPVLVVQHMPPLFTAELAKRLDRKCALKVMEAADEQPVIPGEVYLAPGGKQMKVVTTEEDAIQIRITDDPPEQFCCPSVDYLFRSVAEVYGPAALAVILTGMGSDGTKGMSLMKTEGAYTIAQDEETSTVFGMPRSAINAGVVDLVLPLPVVSQNIMAHF